MCGAPSDVPVVGYGLCLPRFHPWTSCGGLSIAEAKVGVKSLG